MVKTKDHSMCICCTKLRNFYTDIPDMFHFYLRSVIAFLYVCMSARVFINLITIAVISIDLFYLKVNYFVNIFQNNDFSAWNFTDHIWVLEIW
jgi:hypothetical protein